MSEIAQPGRYWRNVIRNELRRYEPPAGSEDETHFRAYVLDEYQREKEHLVQLDAGSSDSAEKTGTRLAVYFLAIILLTYGDLDALDDILIYVPEDRHPARVLARSVHSLLPLGKHHDVLARPLEVSSWVKTHRSRLTWNENLSRFILDADET